MAFFLADVVASSAVPLLRELVSAGLLASTDALIWDLLYDLIGNLLRGLALRRHVPVVNTHCSVTGVREGAFYMSHRASPDWPLPASKQGVRLPRAANLWRMPLTGCLRRIEQCV